MRKEILNYYSEKSKESNFSQNNSAIFLVPVSLQSFPPGVQSTATWPRMCFLNDSHLLWKTCGPFNHVSHCFLITDMVLCF